MLWYPTLDGQALYYRPSRKGRSSDTADVAKLDFEREDRAAEADRAHTGLDATGRDGAWTNQEANLRQGQRPRPKAQIEAVEKKRDAPVLAHRHVPNQINLVGG